MKYLALLKQLQKNGPGTALTEPPKPSSVGFVSSHPHPFSRENEPEQPHHINDGAHLPTIESAETASESQKATENVPEKGPHLALTEPTKPGFVSFDSATPPLSEKILQREEAGAWSWLRRFLGWDTVPAASIRAAAEDAGVSWQIVQRCAADRVIVSRCGSYWKMSKPPGWTSTLPLSAL